MLPLLKYSVMRLALFVAAMGLLYLVGIQVLLPNVLLAGVISMLLSYLLLRSPREELSQQIADKVSGRLHNPSVRSRPPLGLDDDAAAEDDAVDRAAERTAAERTAAVDRAAERTAAERTAAVDRAAERTAAERTAAVDRAAERTAAERTAAVDRAAERTAAERTAAAERLTKPAPKAD